LPDILSAPFWITFAIGIVYIEVGSYSLYAGIIILIVVTIIMLLNHFKLISIKTFTSRSSKRSIVLSEMVPNMKMVKLNSMEGFLRGKLAYLRKLELQSVGKLNLIYTIMDFFYTLLP
jgi:ABC-type bacteriocin/lantibiotic exporter with double-glycine peptidase domain